jgi:peroxiredoxin
MTYNTNYKVIADTSDIDDGRFLFTGKILEPTHAIIRDRHDLELAVIYLEPSKMNISIIKDKPRGCIMTGSKTQAEFDKLLKQEEPVYEKLSMLKSRGFDINDSIKNAQDESLKLLLREKSEEITSQWSKTRAELNPIELRFVLENPKSFVTLDHLSNLESYGIISLDSLKSIFNGLDKSLKESYRARFVIEDIRKKEEDRRKKDNVRIGNQAPDFKATGFNQQIITLSQFKEKSVVLLDFWASWCAPCRKSIPYLKTIYNKYHSKGLTIIAVSVDENKKAWIDAVKQDSTDMWFHVQIAEKWPNGPWTNDDIYQNYYYSEIPERFIIDKNGKIIDRFIGYSIENGESLDKLLSEILNK